MIYLIAVTNFFAIFVLYRNFVTLKASRDDLSSQLDWQQKKRFASECEALAWKQQYQLLNKTLDGLKRVGFEASSRQ